MDKIFNSPLGSTFVGLGTNLLQQSLASKIASRREYELYKQKFDYAYDKNSPANMVRRFEEAGLNPSLMYQGGAGSLSTSISQGAVNPVTNDVFGYQRMLNETKLAEAQAHYYESQAVGQDKENATFDERFEIEMSNIRAQTKNTNSLTAINEIEELVLNSTASVEIQKAYKEFEKLDADTELSKATKQQILADIALKDATIRLNEALARKADSDIKVNEQQVQYLIAQTDFTYKNGELVMSMKDKTDEEAYRLECTHEEYEFLLNWQGQCAKEMQNKTDSERRLINKDLRNYEQKMRSKMFSDYAGGVGDVISGIGDIIPG